MDYSIFDSLLDGIFVFDQNRKILYCNTAAATFCDSSAKRLIKGTCFYQIISFSDETLFAMPNGEWGKVAATPLTEVEFKILSNDKKGKVQVAIQPFHDREGENRWLIILHDVTLEDVLHGKYRAELEQKEGYIVELRKAQQKLELYSKNLEKMVEERTFELRVANQMLNAIMNSLGQGFLIFDPSGQCGTIFTRACLDILECSPAGMKIWEVLKLFGPLRDQFMKWVEVVFKEALPFDNLMDLAPRLFSHSQNRHVTLDYYPLRDEAEKIHRIVIVATDKTAEYEASLALEREKQSVQMVTRIIRSRDQFARFLSDSREAIIRMQKMVAVENIKDLQVMDLFRTLHTLEGEAAAYSIGPVRAAARMAQEVLEPLKWGTETVDAKSFGRRLKTSLKDISVAFNQFLHDNESFFEVLGLDKSRKVEVAYSKVLAFRQHLEKYGVQPRLLQDFEDDFIRTPIKNCLRAVEEAGLVVAAKQGKSLKPFRYETGAVHIIVDKYEKLLTSLIHAIRNAVDHGIEDPSERLAEGKPEAGQIMIRAQWIVKNSGRWLKIEIQDDGRGIDPDRIRERLDQRYPSVDWKQKNDNEVLQYVFEAGLSSRNEIGEFSGRGIGMDAILHEARLLGGDASIESEQGRGTTLIIEVPDQSLQDIFQVSA